VRVSAAWSVEVPDFTSAIAACCNRPRAEGFCSDCAAGSNQWLDVGAQRDETFRRFREHHEVSFDFLCARPRKQRQDRTRRIETVFRAKLRTRHCLRLCIEQRVSDKHGFAARLGKQRFLERQNHGEPIRGCNELRNTAPVPSPDLWHDVVQNTRPGLTRSAREAHIEAGIIDGYDEIRPLLPHRLADSLPESQKEGQSACDFDEPHDGEVVEIGQQVHTRSAHAWPAKSPEPGIWEAGEKRTREAGAMQITGWLARGEKDVRAGGRQVSRLRYQIM